VASTRPQPNKTNAIIGAVPGDCTDVANANSDTWTPWPTHGRSPTTQTQSSGQSPGTAPTSQTRIQTHGPRGQHTATPQQHKRNRRGCPPLKAHVTFKRGTAPTSQTRIQTHGPRGQHTATPQQHKRNRRGCPPPKAHVTFKRGTAPTGLCCFPSRRSLFRQDADLAPSRARRRGSPRGPLRHRKPAFRHMDPVANTRPQPNDTNAIVGAVPLRRHTSPSRGGQHRLAYVASLLDGVYSAKTRTSLGHAPGVGAVPGAFPTRSSNHATTCCTTTSLSTSFSNS